MIGLVIFLVLDFGLLYFMDAKEEWDAKKSIEAGKIQIGISASDMEGKKYQGIIEQLEEPIKEYTFKELEQVLTTNNSTII